MSNPFTALRSLDAVASPQQERSEGVDAAFERIDAAMSRLEACILADRGRDESVVKQINDAFAAVQKAEAAARTRLVQQINAANVELNRRIEAVAARLVTLESIPRQTINLTAPETRVNVELPLRRTEVHRDAGGRITHTTQPDEAAT